MPGHCWDLRDHRGVIPRPGPRRRAATGIVVALLAVITACSAPLKSATPEPEPTPSVTPTPSPTPSPSPSRTLPSPAPSDRPVVGATPPPWLGKRVLPLQANGFGEIRPTPPELVVRRFTLPDRLPPLPGTGFASRVTTPAPADVIARSTWKQGCPVAAGDLSWLRLTFVGFDGRRHTGELLVNSSVAGDLVEVFRRLYAARFPLEEMRITRADELDAPRPATATTPARSPADRCAARRRSPSTPTGSPST